MYITLKLWYTGIRNDNTIEGGADDKDGGDDGVVAADSCGDDGGGDDGSDNGGGDAVASSICYDDTHSRRIISNSLYSMYCLK